MTTAEVYADFARRQASGVSPSYQRLAYAVARDDDLLALLDSLPPPTRQPDLLFGVVRLLGGPVDEPAAFHDFTVARWPAVEAQLRRRLTQTNEAGRCAVLLPVLAALPQPLALLEVGASAGLCLYPDRSAPPEATLVVFHTAVLYHVPASRRSVFVDLVRGLPLAWTRPHGQGMTWSG
ncbi:MULTISPECIES: DUF2332 family protein [unclassified Micromonospora]|uniref:DUF2332 family protein n=1 Tax=unclassified Micromonospora TaxID=2617518 RepID=UPI003A897094